MSDEIAQSSSRVARQSQFSAARGYLLTVFIVILTTLLRLSLNPLLGRRAAFIVYFPALVFSAWLGGWGSGLVALVLSTLAAVYFFIAPARSLLITNSVDQITLVMFLLVGLSVSALSASQRKAHAQAKEARQQAEEARLKALRAADDAEMRRHALEQSEARYRLLLASASEGIYGIDPEGRFTFVNRAAAKLLGFTQEQLLEQDGHALIHQKRSDGSFYPVEDCPIYRTLRSGESVQVEDDVFWRADDTCFPISYRASPLLEGGEVRGAVVTFFDISERRALDVEREQLVERERNISNQLQAALTPAIPERVPGMALAKYYEAALGEAGVGGDFYDIFPLDKGCTALVVGDLSGKGLAAASQVATVRNMLRYALYRAQTLSGALTSLNMLLAEQGLLTGFATLFVGAYDSGAGTLTYVNCGQEPALVRRTSGAIEFLHPTGPILGTLLEATFEEETVELGARDVLAIFTDGLTEVGATRRAMLEVEGIVDLLANAIVPAEANTAEAVAEHLALSVIAGVDAAAQGGVMRDDMCLLVGVVE